MSQHAIKWLDIFAIMNFKKSIRKKDHINSKKDVVSTPILYGISSLPLCTEIDNCIKRVLVLLFGEFLKFYHWFEPDINNILSGHDNVMDKNEPIYFLNTSISTRSKFISP